ncbi:peptidoglycan-binding protein [Lusitaniella coriacea LEGE 07157]|uniref:Peptidoglycan-binding protein n=1 Tax=Lusitaniella coriacea LEGE 07157 TaxID=945747 RepID=A0A8J7E3W3_9CYAN|nr:peptidoglycan-binding domain-containing protein [Lusitaniella coriacea]MBE9118169.1 peptidoglycan-binding protein [Lusitaniella coriacea LEGE 07157]
MDSTVVAGSTNTIFTQPAPALPLLEKGQAGDAIRVLQWILNSKKFLFQPEEYLDIDGVFGTRTENVIRYFQSVTNLPIDGIVGPDTWALLSLPEGLD